MQKSAEPAPFVDRTEAAPEDGPLARVLRLLHPGSSWNAVRRLIETGKVSVDGEVTRDPARGVRRGSVLAISMRARRPTAGETLPKEAFVYVDSQVVVVRKPAGVSTVPYDETETDTLVDRVHKALKAMNRGNSAPPGIVHRLDKETSGLILFARTLAAKRALKQQFRVHSVHRRYVALRARLRGRAIGELAARSRSRRRPSRFHRKPHARPRRRHARRRPRTSRRRDRRRVPARNGAHPPNPHPPRRARRTPCSAKRCT